ncbi:MAG: hypothetical protein ACP6IU_04290 [Candidatus Asgardarchaeia archaeon]
MRSLNRKIIERILETLENTVWGMTIEEISDATKHHRNTIAKYMPELKKLGLVVTRTVGKYTFWLPSTAYMYRKTNIARVFFQKLSKIIGHYNHMKKVITPFELGRELGRSLKQKDIYKDVDPSDIIYQQDEIIAGFGIFVPTILPRVRYKVEAYNPESDKIRVAVAGCPCDGNPEYKDSCKLMEGFTFGSIEQLGITPVSIREVECMIDGANACTFEVILPKKIKNLMTDNKNRNE